MTNEELKSSLLPADIFYLTIVGEARGEPVEGQIAVGNVIMNRLKSNPNKYKIVHDVVLEPLQFSCWNITDPNRKMLEELANKILFGKDFPDNPVYVQCRYIAQGVYNRSLMDNTFRATHYMTTSLFHSDKRPAWAKFPRTDPISIGHQVFFIA